MSDATQTQTTAGYVVPQNVTGDGGNTTTHTEPDTFTREDLEAIVQKRIDAAKRATRDEVLRRYNLSESDRAELEQARKDRAEAERRKLEEKGQYEAAIKARLDAKDAEWAPKYDEVKSKADKATSRLERAMIDNALLAAAAKSNAIDPGDVAALLRGRVKLSEDLDGVVVYDANGVPAYAPGGAEMTVEQLVQSFLATKPHLVRATQPAPGGGAKGGAAVSTGVGGELEQKRAALEAARKRYRESNRQDSRAGNLIIQLANEVKALEAQSAA